MQRGRTTAGRWGWIALLALPLSACTIEVPLPPGAAPDAVPPTTAATAPSSEALFQFMDPSILPEYLLTTSLPWGENPGESTTGIDFLTYAQPATDSAPASVVSLRLFSQLRTGLVLTVSCPTDEQLSAAVADVRSRVSVDPPRS